MNKEVEKLLKGRRRLVIMTHCHSTNVTRALVSLRKKKSFSVVNTETRPLYQGRKTAQELAKAGIAVETFVDGGMDAALEKADIVLIGADALLKKGVVNKIGSEAIARLASLRKVPVWVVADSWKFAPHGIRVEERDFEEVWAKAPKHVKVRNPAFELVPKRFLKGVVSDLGKKSWGGFLKGAREIK
jgi:ribose 1,5-bisphosphate isomerase